MKKMRFSVITCIALAISATCLAKNEKKNEPDKREVAALLKEIGPTHYPEKMKIRSVGPVKVEPTYYHVFCGEVKKMGYRVIIFDNKEQYLGYYQSDYEPSEYEEGAILLDSGDSDSDGSTVWYSIPIGQKGPAAKIRINGIPISFIKNPNLQAETKSITNSDGSIAVPKPKSKSGEVIDYRDWKITMKGRTININARFEKFEDGKVHIKNAKNGKIAQVPGSALSNEDKEYVKRITKK